MDQNIAKVHSNFTLSTDEYESLILLYQPLFSYPALSLYLSLYEFAKVDKHVNLDELKRILQIERSSIDIYRKELERFSLIRTFAGKELEILLIRPLSPADFFLHSTYARLYSIVMGHKKFIDLSHRYRQECIQSKEEISESFDLNRLAIWDEEMEDNFSKKDVGTKEYSYNVDAFLKRISPRLFPIELRTEKTKQIIAEMATMYKLNFSDLRTALFASTNIETLNFDEKRFIYSIEREHGKLSREDVDDVYELDPVSFLIYLQGHDYVVDADKNLIQSLSRNFSFSSEVINVLLEYVLKNNDNNLTKAYVEKIASVWKREGVKDKETALKQIEKPVFKTKSNKKSQSIKRHTAMPTYSDEVEIDEDVDDLKHELEQMFKKG